MLILFNCTSCVTSDYILNKDDYNKKSDIGTYQGFIEEAYDGPLYIEDPAICPQELSISMNVEAGRFSFRVRSPMHDDPANDDTPIPTYSGTINANNRFLVDTRVVPGVMYDALIAGLDTHPCSNYGGTHSKIGYLVSDNLGHVGEIGFGKVRGNLYFGLECIDSTLIPLCIYFLDLQKTN